MHHSRNLDRHKNSEFLFGHFSSVDKFDFKKFPKLEFTNPIKFKLEKGDLSMMDNHRLLHGRTAYDPSEGKRYLKGCYIDHDSTEGKLRYLERKFELKWKK